ncbi:hypothetical protein [Labrys neptuniae]
MKNTVNQPSKEGEQSRVVTTTVPVTRSAHGSTWQPEPCGLSREELRKIIADQLG